MARRKTSEVNPELLKMQVAFLASEGMFQKEIAQLLNISQSTVSLTLQEAADPVRGGRRLLDKRPRFLGTPQEREESQNSMYLGDLKARLEDLGHLLRWQRVPEVHIGFSDPSERSWDRSVIAWAKAIAPSITESLSRCRTVSVSWGRQMRAIVDAMMHVPRPMGQSGAVKIFPVWAPRLSVVPDDSDTLFGDHVALGSNSLARDLSIALNGPDGAKMSAENFLPGIDLLPFVHPPFDLGPGPLTKTDKEALEEERQYVQAYRTSLRAISSYRTIFGASEDRSEAIVRKSDAMLLSMGPAGTPRSFFCGDEYGGVSGSWFANNTIGDIGGVLLPTPDSEDVPAGRKPRSVEAARRIELQFERFRLHWNGMTEEDLFTTAKHGRYGNIVCGVGSDRATIALVACHRQLVNHLYIDLTLAHAFTNLVKSELARLKARKNTMSLR